jgi:CubicO group peptidase (beta-lactamase class C family)
VSGVAGTTFEQAMTELVLVPAGMERSTFPCADVPAGLGSTPHVGRPLVVPGDACPYTRRHAPSTTLHSNLVEMSRWIHAVSDATVLDAEWSERIAARVLPHDDPPCEEAVTLAWASAPGAATGR